MLAERGGFEPPVPGEGTRHFQCRTFGHSVISPWCRYSVFLWIATSCPQVLRTLLRLVPTSLALRGFPSVSLSSRLPSALVVGHHALHSPLGRRRVGHLSMVSLFSSPEGPRKVRGFPAEYESEVSEMLLSRGCRAFCGRKSGHFCEGPIGIGESDMRQQISHTQTELIAVRNSVVELPRLRLFWHG